MSEIIQNILNAPLNSKPLMLLSVVYAIVESIRIYDARLNQAKMKRLDSRIAVEADGRILPRWVGIFHLGGWIIFIALLLLDWKYALVLYVFLFVLRVLPILERIGSIFMHPFLQEQVKSDELEQNMDILKDEIEHKKNEIAAKEKEINDYINAMRPVDQQHESPQFHMWIQELDENLNLDEALERYTSEYNLLRPSKIGEPTELTVARARIKILEESKDQFSPDVKVEIEKYLIALRSTVAMWCDWEKSEALKEILRRRHAQLGEDKGEDHEVEPPQDS